MTGTSVIIMVLSGLCFLPSCFPRLYILVEKERNWAAAQTYCRSKYTDLASVRNKEDLRALQKLLNPSNRTWIGLHADTEAWKWSLEDQGHYGEGEAGFRKWKDGEPDGRALYKMCVSMLPDGQWADDQCSIKYKFVCYDKGAKDTSSSFIFVNEHKTWEEAQDYCRDNYTDLASVRNQKENNQSRDVTKGQRAWIGLYRDSWKWSDGSAPSFSYWAHKAPYTKIKGTCAISKYGRWYKRHCSETFFFVCHSDPPSVKRQVVRVALRRMDSSVDMEELKEDILQQFKERLKEHNVEEDVKLRWVEQPDGKVFHKEHERKEERGSCK